MQREKSQRRSAFTLVELLVVVFIIGCLLVLLLPFRRTAGDAARRTQCKNNLKMIGLALHNYHDVYGSFPPAYTVDANGNRLHSWRVLILPYLDQAPLYEQIDLSKAWDDPANAKAFETQIPTYLCPSTRMNGPQTVYVAMTRSGQAFSSTGRPLKEFTDGTSQTLLVAETIEAQMLHWMSPFDDQINVLNNFKPDVETQHPRVLQVLFADGSVRALSTDTDKVTLQALSTVDGGENLDPTEY